MNKRRLIESHSRGEDYNALADCLGIYHFKITVSVMSKLLWNEQVVILPHRNVLVGTIIR